MEAQKVKRYAVIVAGGSGTRMGAPLSKQYLPVGGKPILMHTLEKFHSLDKAIELILVIPVGDFPLWDQLCRKHHFLIPHQLVGGGKSRFQSVKNGLEAITGDQGLVAIHDGVRPFVRVEVIQKSYEEAFKHGSAITVVPLKDSIRKIFEAGNSVFQDRQSFRLVQTPQTFDLSKIKKAFFVEEMSQFTDDATVFEYQGWQVHLIPGNYENIKITTPEDMEYAEFILGKKKF